MIKKLLPILLLVFPMMGYSNSKQLNKQSAVKEINNFFNSQYADYAADLTITGSGTTHINANQ